MLHDYRTGTGLTVWKMSALQFISLPLQSIKYRCWNEDTPKRSLCPSLHLSDPKPVGLRHFNFPGISWGERKGWRPCWSEELVYQKEISQFQQCARSLRRRAWSQDWLMCQGKVGSHLEQDCLSMRTFTLDRRLKQAPYEEESNGIQGRDNDHTIRNISAGSKVLLLQEPCLMESKSKCTKQRSLWILFLMQWVFMPHSEWMELGVTLSHNQLHIEQPLSREKWSKHIFWFQEVLTLKEFEFLSSGSFTFFKSGVLFYLTFW